MTYARTIALLVTLAAALAATPTLTLRPAADSNGVRVVEDIAPMMELETLEPIVGVRVVTEDAERAAWVRDAVQRFADAGWPLHNTEVRFGGACDGVVGYHAFERGHHVVVMCKDVEFTLLHELGHVWADLYLDEAEREAWLGLRGLDSWSEGGERLAGTEHVADIVASGLSEHFVAPRSLNNPDYDDSIAAFEWLMGVPPLYLRS